MCRRRTSYLLLTGVIVVALTAAARALEPGLPSKTAIYIAAARAMGSKNPNAKERNPDYLAIRFLGPEERAILPELHLEALDLDYEAALHRVGGVSVSNIDTQTFRTKAFDAAMLDALKNGAKQVVVLGAGLDSRGYRFQRQLKGIRFMEVDYGPTQEYKKRRVKEVLGTIPPNVSFVPMDFTKDNLLDQLVKGGYSERDRTFFLWEGVTVYLPESAVKDTLHFVRDHAAPGSRLAFNYIPARNSDINNPHSKYALWGEPWIFGFPDAGAADYVRAEGLNVLSDNLRIEHICIAAVPKRP